MKVGKMQFHVKMANMQIYHQELPLAQLVLANVLNVNSVLTAEMLKHSVPNVAENTELNKEDALKIVATAKK